MKNDLNVSNFFDVPTEMLITIHDCSFHRGNQHGGDDTSDPRLKLRVTVSNLDDDLNEVPFEGVSPDAWFTCLLKGHKDDDDGSKLRTKMVSLMRALSLNIPVTHGKIKFFEDACKEIQSLISEAKKDDLVLPKLMVTATTAQSHPFWGQDHEGNRTLRQGARYVNIGFINIANSQYFNNEY